MRIKDGRVVKRYFGFVIEKCDNESGNKATEDGRERVWV